MGNKLAKFCGKFEDKHHETDNTLDDDDDDKATDEEGDMLPKDYDRIRKEMLKPQGIKEKALQLLKPKGVTRKDLLGNSDALASKYWSIKQTTVPVEEAIKGGGSIHRYADAIIVYDEKIRTVMLKRLRTFQTMHTIELVHCGLKDVPPNLTDIETLRVLRLTRNQIRTVRKELTKSSQGSKYSSLQRILMDENRIDMIERGTFCKDAVKELIVINLGKNQISMLPIDFCAKALKLEILDLSFNKLQSLPECIVECKELRILDVCNNDLRSVPERIDRLTKLRKLFLNTNKLTELPETIGSYTENRILSWKSSLEKLWLSDNCLRYLPETIIDLWKGEGGCLEEIMVDDNPLVVPSVTAFQMGGPDQMFRLFKEHRDERKRREQEMLALPAPTKEQMALSDSPAQPDVADADAIPDDAHAAALPMNNAVSGGFIEEEGLPDEPTYRSYGDDGEEEQYQDEGTSAFVKREPDFYFETYRTHDGQWNYDKISKVRSAESSLMLLKRQMYVDQIKELAKNRKMEAKKHSRDYPKRLDWYSSDEFDVRSFKGSVHVADLDIFFCLLVISAKPLCATAKQLYDRFTPHGEMDRKNWDYFCARIPAKLPEEIKNAMWRMISWRSHGNGADADSAIVELDDFIAAMHIHDIASRDPFIQRVAQVLKLKYYHIEMMNSRRRSEEEATTQQILWSLLTFQAMMMSRPQLGL
jgi:hypothetical protein